jgi:hypothetical protein
MPTNRVHMVAGATGLETEAVTCKVDHQKMETCPTGSGHILLFKRIQYGHLPS